MRKLVLKKRFWVPLFIAVISVIFLTIVYRVNNWQRSLTTSADPSIPGEPFEFSTTNVEFFDAFTGSESEFDANQAQFVKVESSMKELLYKCPDGWETVGHSGESADELNRLRLSFKVGQRFVGLSRGDPISEDRYVIEEDRQPGDNTVLHVVDEYRLPVVYRPAQEDESDTFTPKNKPQNGEILVPKGQYPITVIDLVLLPFPYKFTNQSDLSDLIQYDLISPYGEDSTSFPLFGHWNIDRTILPDGKKLDQDWVLCRR